MEVCRLEDAVVGDEDDVERRVFIKLYLVVRSSFLAVVVDIGAFSVVWEVGFDLDFGFLGDDGGDDVFEELPFELLLPILALREGDVDHVRTFPLVTDLVLLYLGDDDGDTDRVRWILDRLALSF